MVVLNLSSDECSKLELTFLAHPLDHSIPSRSIKHKDVYWEFAVLFTQLRRLQPVSTDHVSDLKAQLNDLALAYVGSLVISWESDGRSEHLRTLISLSWNNSLVITRPDKDSGVVILDYQCNVNKMMSILGDTTKFLKHGAVDCFDHTTSTGTKVQRSLVELVKRVLPSSAIDDQIRSTGCIRPRLYSLTKTHKDGVPLRSILSMVGSPQKKNGLTSHCNQCLNIIVLSV